MHPYETAHCKPVASQGLLLISILYDCTMCMYTYSNISKIIAALYGKEVKKLENSS